MTARCFVLQEHTWAGAAQGSALSEAHCTAMLIAVLILQHEMDNPGAERRCLWFGVLLKCFCCIAD